MANLTADRMLTTSPFGSSGTLALPGENAVEFFTGGFVVIHNTAGVVKKAADTANFRFVGIVGRRVTADGAQGDKEVYVICGPLIIRKHAVTGVAAVTDVGKLVYATDDQTLTLTANTNLKAIGKIVRWHSGTTCDVLMFSPAEHEALY